MTSKDLIGKLSNRKLYFYMAYWIIYLGFFTVQRFFAKKFMVSGMGLVEGDNLYALKESFITNLAYLPEVVITTHFVVNFLLPRFYFRNRFKFFYLLLFGTIFVYPVIPFFVRTFIVEPYLYNSHEVYSFYNYFAAMLIFVFGMAPLGWFRIAAHLQEDYEFHQKIDNDRLKALLKLKETELKLLKSQLHPHFLFNTLNNLYSLALEKSDKTPDLIIRLGDMLSYIIYDCNSDKVQLSKELDFIKSYIELQKVRYDSCDIEFTVKGEINQHKIAPMLLHTFVDNSFKHGAAKSPGNSWIKISMEIDSGSIEFAIVNNSSPEKRKAVEAGGIGIENTRKRLELIYKHRYELVIDDSTDRYSVFLKLQL